MALAERNRLRVVSAEAGRNGIRSGMTVPEARSRLASIITLEWDDAAVREAVSNVTALLLGGSPQVAPAPASPGTWFAGAGGMDGIGGERELARTILEIVRPIHPDARVAVADSCVAARAATWVSRAHEAARSASRNAACTSAITIVPPGGCAAYLAPAPIGLIPMSGDMRESLQSLGLRTVGEFAALDPGDVELRWGAGGLGSWRLAHGDDPRRPGLVRVDSPRAASIELPAPVTESAPLLFPVRALLERLTRTLIEDGRAAAAVAVTLALDTGRSWPAGDAAASTTSLLSIPHRTITREVRPAHPVAQPELLFSHCRSLLESWAIPAQVIGVALSIPATAPIPADQGDLLISSWRDTAIKADEVFTRLRTALDPPENGDVVVRPVLNDSQQPEQAASWVRANAAELAKPDEYPQEKPSGAGLSEAGPTRLRLENPTETPPKLQAYPRSVAEPAPRFSVIRSREGTVQSPPVQLLSTQSPPVQLLSTQSPPVQLLPVMRLLPVPEAVRVMERSGVPVEIRRHERRFVLACAEGPERLSGDWWRTSSYTRDYWRCNTESGAGLLLFKSGKQWYLQGWYD